MRTIFDRDGWHVDAEIDASNHVSFEVTQGGFRVECESVTISRDIDGSESLAITQRGVERVVVE